MSISSDFGRRGASRLLVMMAMLGAVALLAACGALGTASPSGTAKSGPADRVAKAGDRVSVNYTGTLDDGTVFDSSKGRAPLQFTIGAGDVIVGFDRAVTGLAVGQKAKSRMEAKDAYGERREDRVIKIPADQVPPDVKVGQTIYGSNQQPALVKAIAPDGVTLDLNHPLAGQALTFEVELVSIDVPAK